MPYLLLLLGAAQFDPNGLPQEYFITADRDDIIWVQAAFQGLGLQALLASSLQLEGFHHLVVHSTRYQAIVVKQKSGYVALLLPPTADPPSAELLDWACQFETSLLVEDARFSLI